MDYNLNKLSFFLHKPHVLVTVWCIPNCCHHPNAVTLLLLILNRRGSFVCSLSYVSKVRLLSTLLASQLLLQDYHISICVRCSLSLFQTCLASSSIERCCYLKMPLSQALWRGFAFLCLSFSHTHTH